MNSSPSNPYFDNKDREIPMSELMGEEGIDNPRIIGQLLLLKERTNILEKEMNRLLERLEPVLCPDLSEIKKRGDGDVKGAPASPVSWDLVYINARIDDLSSMITSTIQRLEV